MYFSSHKERQELSLLLPKVIDLETFLLALARSYDLDVKIETVYEKHPLRLRGRLAHRTQVSISGAEQEAYILFLERHLEDFLEANGYFI